MDKCKVKVENNTRLKISSFWVTRKWKALLGMPDIKTLDILPFNCSTIDTKEVDGAANHKMNTSNYQELTCEKQYVNKRQEAETPEKCCTNTDNTSKFENND